MIGRNLLTQKNPPLKMEFKYILFRKLPFCRFDMHSLCENEKIPFRGKRHNKISCFPSYRIINCACVA